MMMPLNNILGKYLAGYKLSKSREMTLCTWTTSNSKKRKRIGNTNSCSKNIQSRHRGGMCHRTIHHASKRHQADGMELLNQKQNKNARKKGNFQILRDIGS